MALKVEVEALDVISNLGRELVLTYEAENETVATIVDALLAFQVLSPAITVGTISDSYNAITRSIKVDGDTVLRALYRLRDTVGGYIYVNNARQLMWYDSLGEDVGQQIRYNKNLRGITREIDYHETINRLYAYGKSKGEARISLSDVESDLTGNANSGQKDVAVTDGSLFAADDTVTISDDNASESNTIDSIAANTLTMTTNLVNTYTTVDEGAVNRGLDYIEDAASQAAWGGIFAGSLKDPSITHPDTLLAWANLKLAELKVPVISYTVDVVDLNESNMADFSFDALQLGSTVNVIDEDLGIDVSVSIVRIEHFDLANPQTMILDLSTRSRDITDVLTEQYDIRQFDQHIATEIGAGQVIVKGTFTVLDWATGGETTINGANIETSTITLNALNFVALTSYGTTDEIIATINASAEGGGTLKISAAKLELTAGISTFRQGETTDGIPTSTSIGDIWFDSDDGDKAYRAASVGADEITTGEWIEVQDDQIATNQAAITASETQIALNVTEITSIDGRVTTAESSIIINSDNILLKVDLDGVIVAINLSEEGVRIEGDNITLDGDVNCTGDFEVQGSIATGETLTVIGTISAGNGDILITNTGIWIDNPVYLQVRDSGGGAEGSFGGGAGFAFLTGVTTLLISAPSILVDAGIDNTGSIEFRDDNLATTGSIYTRTDGDRFYLVPETDGEGTLGIDSHHIGHIYNDFIYNYSGIAVFADIVFQTSGRDLIGPFGVGSLMGTLTVYPEQTNSDEYNLHCKFPSFDQDDDIALLRGIGVINGLLDVDTFPDVICSFPDLVKEEKVINKVMKHMTKEQKELFVAYTFDKLSHKAVSVGNWQSLLMGAILQLADKVDDLEAELAARS